MSSVKIHFTLDEDIARQLKERATTTRKPASRYVAELVEADMRRYQEELAAEGYRLLSDDTRQFACATLPLANETWPEWKTPNAK